MADQIKVVLFDMDGVLIDAREWHYEALNRALGMFGFAIGRYEHVVTYDGLPTRKKLEMLSRERGLPTGLHTLLNDLKLTARGIQWRRWYTPLVSIHPKLQKVGIAGSLIGAEAAESRLLGLPFYISLQSESVLDVVDTISWSL